MIPNFRKDFFVTAAMFAKGKKHRKVEQTLKKETVVRKRLPDGKSRPAGYRPPVTRPNVRPAATPQLVVVKKDNITKKKMENILKIEKQLKELEIFYLQLAKNKQHSRKDLDTLAEKIKYIKNMIRKKKGIKQKT